MTQIKEELNRINWSKFETKEDVDQYNNLFLLQLLCHSQMMREHAMSSEVRKQAAKAHQLSFEELYRRLGAPTQDASMKLRPLLAEEVVFEVRVEPEDTPVRGNYMATDDDEADRAAEDAVIAAIDAGEERAWCCVTVVAHWRDWRGQSSLGCVAFTPFQTPQKEAEDLEELVTGHGMRKEALEYLNQELQKSDDALSLLRVDGSLRPLVDIEVNPERLARHKAGIRDEER